MATPGNTAIESEIVQLRGAVAQLGSQVAEARTAIAELRALIRTVATTGFHVADWALQDAAGATNAAPSSPDAPAPDDSFWM